MPQRRLRGPKQEPPADAALPVIIGWNVARLRVQAELTQQDLARAIGVGRQYVIDIEKGDARNPSTDVLVNLAKSLNVDESALLRRPHKTVLSQK